MPDRLVKIGENRYTLDLRGYVCPYTSLLTVDAMRKIRVGDTIDVVTDNPPSCKSIPTTAERHGWKVIALSEIDKNRWKISIVK